MLQAHAPQHHPLSWLWDHACILHLYKEGRGYIIIVTVIVWKGRTMLDERREASSLEASYFFYYYYDDYYNYYSYNTFLLLALLLLHHANQQQSESQTSDFFTHSRSQSGRHTHKNWGGSRAEENRWSSIDQLTMFSTFPCNQSCIIFWTLYK